ncbi:VanZ family protein [Photobacterium nomapromontoriensis]|uniref:VanZ family protein n=1 Tax=Photobacterium nomapromontoriensis TaxID=2910237 RepID=UPI003D0A207C
MNSYGILFLDKMAHTLAYAIFAVQGFIQLKNRRRYMMLCIAIALYGMLLELIQHVFIPQRMGAIDDALANIIGVFIGYTVCMHWIKKHTNQD